MNFNFIQNIPKLEKLENEKFNLFFNKSSISLFRFSIVISIVAMFFYFYLDYLSAPVSYFQMWIFRGLIVLIFLIGLSFSYTKYMVKYFQVIANFVNIFFNTMIVLMIYVSQPNEMAYNNYYAGIMVVWLVSIPMRIRLKPFVFNFVFIFSLYMIVAITKQDYLVQENIKYLINNISFLLTTVLAVIIADFLLEIFIKKNFMQTQVLEKQNIEISLRNEEITAQKDEIEIQKQQLEKNHKEIASSINYASRIQKALLPSDKLFNANFKEYFVFYKPKNVVSGDFYWAKEINDYFVFIAADCTGHGVPGGFLSMLGISFLNEIIRFENVHTAAYILEEMRKYVKDVFKQNAKDDSQKDGMDMSVCIINKHTKEMQYAGAYNSLYIMVENNAENKLRTSKWTENSKIILHSAENSNKKLFEIKADRQPVAIYVKEKPFTNHIVQLEENDMLYLFSDGYIDQFGGDKVEKFTIKRFRELIIEIANMNMKEQNEAIISIFDNWTKNIDQMDDVLVIGLKI